VTIEGRVDHGDPGLTDRDRRIEQKPPAQPPGDAADSLDEPNGTKWLKNVLALLAGAETRQTVIDLREDPRVSKVFDDPKTPSLIKAQLVDAFGAAFGRFAEPEDNAGHAPDGWPDDPIAELLAEVEAMDLVAINGLKASATWRKRVRDAAQIPPDEDRLNEAIAARRAALQGRA
jgi:hypothetical protein